MTRECSNTTRPSPVQLNRCSCQFQPLERRLHQATTIAYYNQFLTDLSHNVLYAEVRVGDNGCPDGVTEVVLGSGTQELSSGRVEWDPELSDGFDSGWRPFRVSVDLNGSDYAEAGITDIAQTISTSSFSAQHIDRVMIRAAVLAPDLTMTFRDVVVKFYRNGALVDMYSSLSGPSANSVGATDWNPRESMLQITPSASNVDEVVVDANIRMKAEPGTMPGQTDIFGQVLIFDDA